MDATLGLRGHFEAPLNSFPNLRGPVLDRDVVALELPPERLATIAPEDKVESGIWHFFGEFDIETRSDEDGATSQDSGGEFFSDESLNDVVGLGLLDLQETEYHFHST